MGLPPPYTPPLIPLAVIKNWPVTECEGILVREARHVQLFQIERTPSAYDVIDLEGYRIADRIAYRTSDIDIRDMRYGDMIRIYRMFAELSTLDVRSG